LFTNGMKKFDEYYENGIIDRILTTNLIYQTPELLSRPYYTSVDMSKYIALLVDSLNHDLSISDLLNPTDRINALMERHRAELAARGL
ncbi:MAG: ribose-phosphate pyrophosphokinase, partial [Verrucomicrobia bacterium]|nr:ribose-phosphate pyrophosphokinase [Verrucomicrobiota bacterium]